MKRISLYFNANIENYQITVYDGCNVLRKQISTRQAQLSLCAQSPCLRIVATPLTDGYSTILYFCIPTSCQPSFSLFCNFLTLPSPSSALNRFTLTDANYNLPIDGTLFFTQS